MWVGAGLWHDTDFYTAFEDVAPRRVRLVDVPGLRAGRLHPLRPRRSDGRARQPHRELQRIPAQPAVGGRMDRRTRRATIASTAALVLRPRSMKPAGDRPAVHRARARGRRHSRAAHRGGCRRRARVGSGAARARPSRRSSTSGCANDDDQLARVAPGAWLLPFGVTLIAMFALQLSNLGFSPLLPSIQQEFGMSFTQLGFFTGIYGLLAMLLSVPAGVSAKRFGEKRVLARRAARCRGRQRAARASVELRVGDCVPGLDDLRLPVRLRQRAHRCGADGAAVAARPHDGRARRDVGAGVGDRRAARRRARRRVRLAQRDPGLRGDGGARRHRLLAVLSRDGRAEPRPSRSSAAQAIPRSALPLARSLDARADRRARRLRSVHGHLLRAERRRRASTASTPRPPASSSARAT